MLSNSAFGLPSVQPFTPSICSSAKQPHLSPTSVVFASIDDELHDARRVHSHGQEEDLRYALDRVIKRVEELSSLLKIAYKTHTELETSLSVAKSNLQLMMSNNEMLEEALKRETPCSAKDVGWRRWSAREAQNMQRVSEERPRSVDYGPLNESGVASHPINAAPAVIVNGTLGQQSRPSTPSESPAPSSTTSQSSNQEGRFFKFRFSSGSKSSAVLPNQQHTSHLTSPSLPTLVASSREKELLELQEQLERERRAHDIAIAEKAALEAELESLSQALFEEANKMVATERVKRAETEEELQEVRLEKDALKEALRLIEGEHCQLRTAQLFAGGTSDRTAQQPSSHSRSSSRNAIKSPLASSSSSLPDVIALPSSLPLSTSSLATGESDDIVTCLSTAPSTAPFTTDSLADFILQPAPKPLFMTLQQTSLFKEQVISDAPSDSLPSALDLVSQTSVSFIPDEPSPWADTSS